MSINDSFETVWDRLHASRPQVTDDDPRIPPGERELAAISMATAGTTLNPVDLIASTDDLVNTALEAFGREEHPPPLGAVLKTIAIVAAIGTRLDLEGEDVG